MIDYRTRSRESVFLRDARDVIGFRVQKVRAGIYVNPPTRRMLDWDQCIASIINGICTHLGIAPVDVELAKEALPALSH
jgi:hypothetical protein